LSGLDSTKNRQNRANSETFALSRSATTPKPRPPKPYPLRLEVVRQTNAFPKKVFIMETYKLVMPENLNHYGMLFGGYMLKWVDEIAWVAATLEYPKHRFVTIGMDRVEFRHGVKQGTILRFQVEKTRVGSTSVSYQVYVYREHETNPDNSIFTTTVTMVNVDDFGNKKPL
jgi:acyl-CoA hydrolase